MATEIFKIDGTRLCIKCLGKCIGKGTGKPATKKDSRYVCVECGWYV